MSNWKPIETAPKDGTSVMLYAPMAKTHKMVICHYRSYLIDSLKGPATGGYWTDRTGTNLRNITHWHELPTPPVEQLKNL